jgi:nucleoside 2-deoxyribosyltransferase
MARKLIYIAGPLYTEGDRWYLERIDELCQELGYETYLPHRDAGLALADEQSIQKCFVLDVEYLDRANIVVAVLNGWDVDSGTAWEIGYAYSQGKPILGIHEDSRIYSINADMNLMIVKSVEIVDSKKELKARLLECFDRY